MKYLLAFLLICFITLIIAFILTSCKVSSMISQEEDNINKNI